LKGGASPRPVAVPGLNGATVASVVTLDKTRLLLGTSDGRAIPLDMRFDVTFKDGKRAVVPAPAFGPAVVLDPETKRAVRRLASGGADAGGLTVGQVGPADLVVQGVSGEKEVIGGLRTAEELYRANRQ